MASPTPNRSTWFSSPKPATPDPNCIYKSLSLYVPDLNFENFATPEVATAFAIGSLTTVGVVALSTRYFKRIPTSDWVRENRFTPSCMWEKWQVHPRMIARKKWIKGVVTRYANSSKVLKLNWSIFVASVMVMDFACTIPQGCFGGGPLSWGESQYTLKVIQMDLASRSAILNIYTWNIN